MSKFLIIDENNEYVEVEYKKNECDYKVNGICFNNKLIKKLGKKCYKECENMKKK